MTRETAIQLACLYGPLVGAGLLAIFHRPPKLLATGLLFATLWVAALLPWLDAAARAFGLWEYHARGPELGGMPLSLYLGWSFGWGLFAPLLVRALGDRLWLTAAALILLDLRVMPELEPVITLGPRWYLGELPLFGTLLIPALYLARWTANRSHTRIRTAMLVPAFGGIILGIPLLALSSIEAFAEKFNALWIGAGILASVPGIMAVRDLAVLGDGTPVPLDPPRKLVTGGIYGWVRNPMQISMTLLLLLEAAFLQSHWPIVLAALGTIYSEGFARWSENSDMTRRFGTRWTDYRRNTRAWLPRRPQT